MFAETEQSSVFGSAGTSSLTGPAPSSASYRVRAEPGGAWTFSE